MASRSAIARPSSLPATIPTPSCRKRRGVLLPGVPRRLLPRRHARRQRLRRPRWLHRAGRFRHHGPDRRYARLPGRAARRLPARDYRAVADVQFRAGYVPPDQSRETAQACRSIGEPIFGKPSHQISIARLLAHLLRVTEQFEMAVQPAAPAAAEDHADGRGHGHAAQPRRQHLGSSPGR